MMLDGLATHLNESKVIDLLRRLESDDPDQSLPAEYELALTWATSQVAHIHVERALLSRAPDIYAENLFEGRAAYLDVAAVSDGVLSGSKEMRRAAAIINIFCRRLRKDAPSHLHYEFGEVDGYLPATRRSGFARYFRKRRITGAFRLTGDIEGALRLWLKDGPPKKPLRIANEEIDVVVSWRKLASPRANVFSSMPALAYDLVKNPIYRALKRKSDQLRGAPAGCLRGILLGDAGCSPLRDISSAYKGHNVSGQDIIGQFLRDSDVDFVAVFVPRQVNPWPVFGFAEPVIWHLYTYPRTEKFTRSDHTRVEALARALPRPQLYGYQARQLHELGAFKPQRPHYVEAHWKTGVETMTAKFSARALHEFMAGRIDHNQFLNRLFAGDNWFERTLTSGMTIRNVSFEPAGVNKDDDYVVVEFEPDPAAMRLRRPIAKDGGRPSPEAVTRDLVQRKACDP